MKTRRLIVLVMLVLTVALVTAMPASATVPPDEKEGCTPGYWKQDHHLDSWMGYSPEDTVLGVFGYGPEDVTLLEALGLKGGGENAFLRQVVAALLNAANTEVNYPRDEVFVKDKVVETYLGKYDFEFVKDKFEAYNELGCPLD
jgi:hypothetical protein